MGLREAGQAGRGSGRTLTAPQQAERPRRPAGPPALPRLCERLLPSPALLFFIGLSFWGTWVSGHQSTSHLALCPACPPPVFFIQMFLYQCAWVCRDAGLSCCASVSLPGSASPPLGLTKPVRCFLFITQDSQGRKGAQPWGGGGGTPGDG